MANKVALITGVTGQDGSYLVENLLEKGYDVHGLLWVCEIQRLVSLFFTCFLNHRLRSDGAGAIVAFRKFFPGPPFDEGATCTPQKVAPM